LDPDAQQDQGSPAGASLGALLRGRRHEAGLTQEELARKSGLSVRAISDLERGRSTRPYPRTARMLADAMALAGGDRDELLRAARDGRGAAGPAAASEPASGAPRQLPAGIAHISGRDHELAELDELLGQDVQPAGAVVIAAISGMPGVGKTALAVHWARRAASRFPDGQLHANLRGFDAAGQPAEPGDVIRGFLEALQVPADKIPAGLDAQAALYRTLAASRRMIIVLDNARDAAQVRPLLPGARPASSSSPAGASSRAWPQLRVRTCSRWTRSPDRTRTSC
jgi:transcriptional regulator with XRE-family HTH domain